MNTSRQNQLQGYALAAIAALIWSGFIIVSRYGGLSDLTPYDVIAIRYVTCALILGPAFIIWRPFNLLRWELFISAMIGGFAYALFAFVGFSGTPASHAAVLLPGLLPILIYGLSLLFKQESATREKSLGMTIITTGILLLCVDLILGGAMLSGFHVSLAMSAVCWSLYSVLLKVWQISAWEATVSLAIWTFAIFVPIYLLWLPSNLIAVSWEVIATQAVYQGFLATIIQMLCYVRAVQIIGASNMGAVMGFVPLVAGFIAIPVFNEPLSFALSVALVLVSSGVWFSHTRRHTPKEKQLCPTST